MDVLPLTADDLVPPCHAMPAGGNLYVNAPRPARLYLPGSFNPLHGGHQELLQVGGWVGQLVGWSVGLRAGERGMILCVSATSAAADAGLAWYWR